MIRNRYAGFFKPMLMLAAISMLVACARRAIMETSPDKPRGKYALVYSLPRTVVNVRVEAVRTVRIAGPYAAYARKYLGVEEAVKEKSVHWHLHHVTLLPTIEPDPAKLFTLYSGKDAPLDLFGLSKSGIIIKPDYAWVGVNQTDRAVFQESAFPLFTDLSADPFIAEEKSVFYSKVKRDSVFVRVPVKKNLIYAKSIEEKAREAADFIFNLRKRRLEFLTTDTDIALEGKALDRTLAEISRLEREYLSLFIGKTLSDTVVREFEYIPRADSLSATILFRFSDSKGILATSNYAGKPVIIEITSVENANPVGMATLQEHLAKYSDDSWIYYRIPVPVNIRVSSGTDELVSRRLPIYQLGTLLRVNPDYFLTKGLGGR